MTIFPWEYEPRSLRQPHEHVVSLTQSASAVISQYVRQTRKELETVLSPTEKEIGGAGRALG